MQQGVAALHGGPEAAAREGGQQAWAWLDSGVTSEKLHVLLPLARSARVSVCTQHTLWQKNPRNAVPVRAAAGRHRRGGQHCVPGHDEHRDDRRLGRGGAHGRGDAGRLALRGARDGHAGAPSAACPVASARQRALAATRPGAAFTQRAPHAWRSLSCAGASTSRQGALTVLAQKQNHQAHSQEFRAILFIFSTCANQAVRAMLEGLDRGAYILPGPSARNNVLVAATAGAALLAPHVALLAMLFAPLMARGDCCALRIHA